MTDYLKIPISKAVDSPTDDDTPEVAGHMGSRTSTPTGSEDPLEGRRGPLKPGDDVALELNEDTPEVSGHMGSGALMPTGSEDPLEGKRGPLMPEDDHAG